METESLIKEKEPHMEKTDENTTDKKIEFWGTNPNVLFDPSSILQLFPVADMSYEAKLNAISRLVILLTVVFYLIFRSYRSFFMGIITLGAIWALHYSQQKDATKKKKVRFQEGFETSDVVKDFLEEHDISETLFSESTPENPLQNVMLTDYDSAGNKRPAAAAYTEEAQQKVLDHTKSMIDKMNPEQPKITNKLYRSLEDNLAFEQSMRPFYSTASTTIPNDQGAFADFCYGSMVSCKEGNPFACARNLASRHTNV